jgi:hypothetical protein
MPTCSMRGSSATPASCSRAVSAAGIDYDGGIPLSEHDSPGGSLSRRRARIEQHWHRFVAEGRSAGPSVRQDIASSWQRSARYLRGSEPNSPSEDRYLARQLWEASPLSAAARQERRGIEQMALEGDLLAAIADPCGRLLWTFASGHMSKRAEAVNFIDGGRWEERAVGTNAVGLCLSVKRPVTVFSSEHFLPLVHDWVCYAAPILHPRSGVCLGILDLSTTWDRHTPLGQAAVSELARSIAHGLPDEQPRADLEIHALGQPRVVYRGKPLALPQRQIEILCLLALSPQGMDLASLHAALYGDAPVSTTTLKAELSQLRRVLDGRIGSRPYRLEATVWADFVEIWQVLRRGGMTEAAALYRGPLLARSGSPELEEWRYCIDAVMDQALAACDDPAPLLERICSGTAGSELVRERLGELMSAPARRR